MPFAKRPARQVRWTPEIGEEICRRIAAGESLMRICEDDNMPDDGTVSRWLAKDETFRANYARAREEQADALYEEAIEAAREAPKTSKRYDEDGNVVGESTDAAEVQHRRLLIDTLKWAAGKMRPKKYGEASLVKLEGGDGGPVRIEVIRRANAPGTLPPKRTDGDEA